MATISIGGYDTRGVGTLLNNYADSNTAITKRLSTGQRASAAEDPAKDSLAARIEKTVTILKAALEGTATAKSVAEVAEGAATQILKNIQTLSELAIRATNTVSEQDKKLLDAQFQGIMAETNRIATTTKFGDQVLMDGSLAGSNDIETDITGVSDNTKSYSSLNYKVEGLAAANDTKTVEINGLRFKQINTAAADNEYDILYGSDEAIITLKKGTAQNVDNIFKIEGTDIGGANKDAVTFSSAAAAATTDDKISISSVVTTAKDRAQAFADAINGVSSNSALNHAALKNSVTATVIPVGDGTEEAKLVLKRVNTGVAGAESFKVSVLVGSTNNLSDQIKSLQVGTGIVEVKNTVGAAAASAATEYTAYNSSIVGEQITIKDNTVEKIAEKIAKVIQDNNAMPFKLQSSKDIASMLSANIDDTTPDTIKLVSKRQGVAGNFLLKDLNDNTARSAVYDNIARVGSLGVGNVFVSGGVKSDALIKSVGGAVSTTGFVKVDNATLSEGSKIKFGGREFTLRTQIKDPEYEIQLKAGDPVQTLKNVATFLNSSKDPSLANFIFETRAVASKTGTVMENQLKISSKVYSADYNGAVMTIEELTPQNNTTAILTLSGGFSDGLNLSNINDNKDFLGQLKGFKASYEGYNRIKLQLPVGEYMYEGIVENTNPTMDSNIIMKSNKDLGGYFTISLGGGRGFNVGSADDANKFANRMDEAFEQLSCYQQRIVSSFEPAAGSNVENMDAYLLLPEYPKSLNIVSVNAQSAKTTGDASITIMTSDGKVFKNRAGVLGSSTNVGERIELVEEKDSNSKIVLIFGKDVDFSKDDSTKRFEKDLRSAFKADISPMQFQVGEGQDDFIEVKFTDLTIDTLFNGEKLSITSTNEVRKASKVLSDAMTTVISARADVGGLLQTLASSASALEQNIVTTSAALDVMTNVDITGELARYTENNNKIEAGAYVLSQTRTASTRLIQVLFR